MLPRVLQGPFACLAGRCATHVADSLSISDGGEVRKPAQNRDEFGPWVRARSTLRSLPVRFLRLPSLAGLVTSVVILATFPTKPAYAAFDPELDYSTIESKHFRVTYYRGLEDVAKRVADLAEAAHGTMSPTMGWDPDDKTEILVSDTTDGANGSATALPYNAIRLNVTAPEDLSPLGDVDDWLLALITHEHTHVLHLDNMSGLPTLVNRVIGKTLAPNQVQPRWILEGTAVYFESARTSGGRLRSSLWSMYMRTDVLAKNFATLDQFSNYVRRWPQGNIWYLYGSYFIEWVARTYGEDTLRRMAEEYGQHVVPWGISRTIRRVTGKTWDQLYEGFKAEMVRRAVTTRDAVVARGIREGTRLTFHGQNARYPRWIPKGTYPEYEGKLLYYREDADTRPGLYAVALERDAEGTPLVPGPGRKKRPDSELLVRTAGEAYASFAPDGTLYYNTPAFYSNLFVYNEIYRIAKGEKSPSALDGLPERLTDGYRAIDPTVSPDGRRIVFVSNHHGTRHLQIADVGPDGVTQARPLVRSAPYEQAFTPRFSPNGRSIVYSHWAKGGYRDIWLVDVDSGAVREITRDRAVDGGGSFSPDGRTVYYHSDRNGISNVYAYSLDTAETRQVTNVLTGAYYPEVSPDGKTLAYVGYTKDGFDLYAMKLEPARFLDPEPYLDIHPSAPHPTLAGDYVPKPYSPLRTLRPRRYSISTSPGNFGQLVSASIAASDIAGLHGVSATFTQELERPELQGSLSYAYYGQKFDASVSAFRNISPRSYQIGSLKTQAVQEAVGLSTGISYNRTRLYDSQSFSVAYSLQNFGLKLPTDQVKLDPYETPQRPQTGLAGVVSLAYSYTSAERYLRSVGPERGSAVQVNMSFANEALGGDFEGMSANASVAQYFTMPWLSHHSLALRLGAGTSGGTYPGKSAYFVGGFVDLPVVDTIAETSVQGGIVLRGYPAGVQSGQHFTLMNAEYRFPIVNFDRGSSTLPFFLNRLTGAVFFDYGSAFDRFADAKYKSGTGGELWLDTFLGYGLAMTFRLGYARGLASEGIHKIYVVAALPF